MKYGKEFQQILQDPSIPQEWRQSAIEYGKLKKLIKDVVAELSGMGLSPDVLHKLLSTETLGVPDKSGDGEESSGGERETPDEGDILEFEFESPDNSPPTLDPRSSTSANVREAQEVIIAPVPHVDDLAVAGDDGHIHHHRTFRLRLLSETQPEKPAEVKPMSVMDMFKTQSAQKKKKKSLTRQSAGSSSAEEKRGRKHVRRAVVDEHGGVKAEYVLVGDPEHPRPQLRLHLSATSSPDRNTISSGLSSRSASASGGTSTESDTDPITSESEDEPEPSMMVRPTRIISPQHTPRPFQYRSSPRFSPRVMPSIDVIPPSPTLRRLRQAVSPIWALATGNNINDGLRDLSLDESGSSSPRFRSMSNPPDSPTTPKAELDPFSSLNAPINGQATEVSSSSSPTERDFIIPLASDVIFFNILTSALTQLSSFHAAQQEAFQHNVETLCGMIRTSIHPGDAPIVMPTPYNPTPRIAAAADTTTIAMRQPSQRASKKDLYAWREIFSLWIEHEIFESSAERTRGERTVEEAQSRLQVFANEVVKRGLGDRRTIKGKKARGAWEEFLRLNVLLLDLKKFQMANINAARKILKKHDKRTALTASAGFPSFVRSTLANSVDKNGNVLTWNFYNTSLPHVLLASLTNTLLPILPSLDDYACLICTSIAFKPIRLGCGHLFCVRCLVKMQRAGKAECPLCRSKVVLLADKHSLDTTLMAFMKDWFPKEVKEKQKDNDREIAFEHAGGPEADRCVVM